MIKNISKAEVLVLKDQVAYQEGQVTNASPPDSCVLISSPLSKENNVTLNASFCASVLLTTCYCIPQ